MPSFSARVVCVQPLSFRRFDIMMQNLFRVTRIIRTSFLATNIRHQFVKHLDSINIQSSAFSCRWQIFVSQKISDPQALIFRWFWVRRTTQDINLARTTSPKAPKINALGLVRIILVTLAVRASNLIASRRLIYASFGVISLARLIPCFAKSHQNPSKINSPWGASSFDGADFFENKVLSDDHILILSRKEPQLSEKSARKNQFCSTLLRLKLRKAFWAFSAFRGSQCSGGRSFRICRIRCNRPPWLRRN